MLQQIKKQRLSKLSGNHRHVTIEMGQSKRMLKVR